MSAKAIIALGVAVALASIGLFVPHGELLVWAVF